jgi:tRNA threonylcarbamoyladenosine biosynthesis protein TsaB
MLLAIDTCFNACSAALYEWRVLASRHAAMDRGHAEVLGPMVAAAFAEAGVKPKILTRIAVTVGPGTFTGLRIGLAYAKGMALALKLPLTGLDSLTATAAPHFGMSGRIGVVQQAGATGQFYFASFEAPTGACLAAPQFATAEDIAAQLAPGEWHMVGSGASHFADYPQLTPDGPVASSFAAYASRLPVSAQAAAPLYLRAPDAKPSATAKPFVRHATEKDLVVMAELHAQSFAQGWSPASLQASLSVPGAGALVVELAGTVYGFVQFQWFAGEAEINTLCISPNHRRQHFGRDLMTGLLAALQTSNTQRIFLEVSDRNSAALALYESSSFTRTGLRKAYYADGSDAIQMQRVLVP